MPFAVLLAPGGMASGVAAGCHSSNSQSTGRAHTCTILVGGGVKCWGRGDYGQLGYDSTDNKGDAAGEMAGLGTVGVGASVDTCPLQDSPPPPPMSPSSPPWSSVLS